MQDGNDYASTLTKVIGPSNILRKENATNVLIPCPFSGEYNPVWAIDGQYYALINVPVQYKPCSYGLLIPLVKKEMNGTTFQCIIPGPVNQVFSSSIGMLIVRTIASAPLHNSTMVHQHL